MDGFVARRGWIRAMKFEYGENRKDYKEDMESSKEQHIGLDLTDAILHSEAIQRTEVYTFIFTQTFSRHAKNIAWLGDTNATTVLERRSSYAHRPTGRYHITNFHHHAPFPSTQKNND